ncbi:hypothetical protein GE061_009373 [Apolygus lucorum]|uniref:Uncharacterized protein n=1 Tax=Apolygus lucorum TaxID=248454 RepID=A0A8S9XZZ5_APOLU|nr:hypothetical protein GE061_009373 [Apolygus lucorum]
MKGYEITVMEIYSLPLPSKTYFKTICEAFRETLNEEVLPGIFFAIKLWALERIWYWFKFQLDFHRVRRYIGHLRISVQEKKTKARARVKLERETQEQVDVEVGNAFHNQILEAAHDEAHVMMNQATAEEMAIVALSKAARKVNFHHLMVANSVDPNFEVGVLSSLGDTVEFLDRIASAHEVTAFLTATVYMILIVRF